MTRTLLLHEPERVKRVGSVAVFKAAENAEGSQHALVVLMPGVKPGRHVVPGNWNLDPAKKFGRQRGVWHVTELRDGKPLPKGGFYVKEPQPRGEFDSFAGRPVAFKAHVAAQNAKWEARLLLGVRQALGRKARVEQPVAYVRHQYGQARLVTKGFDGLRPLQATRENLKRVFKLKERAYEKGYDLRDLEYTHKPREGAETFLNVFEDAKGRVCVIDGGYWKLAQHHPDYKRFGEHLDRAGAL